MFPWIRRRIIQKSIPLNLEAQVECSFEDQMEMSFQDKAFFAQFSGTPGTDEARGLAQREQLDLAAEALFEHFQIRIKPTFFVHNSESSLIRPKVQEYPDYCREVIRDGRSAIAHTFAPLGIKASILSSQIDWFGDFQGHSWPRLSVKRYRQIFSGPQKEEPQELENPSKNMADLELTWEFNKHSHFVDLARSYWLTDNENLASEFLIEAVSWAEANPVWQGVNWLDMESTSYRTINWLVAINMFLGSKQFTPEIFIKLWRCLILHGCVLAWHLANDPHKCLAAASALWVLSDNLPELKLSKRWHQAAEEALSDIIPQEFGHDGMHLSGQTSSHRLASEWLLLPILSDLLNQKVSPDFLWAACDDALFAIFAMLGPNLTVSEFGSQAGSGLFTHQASPSQHALNLLSLGAIALKRGEWITRLEKTPPELFWWLGSTSDTLFDKCERFWPEHNIYYYGDAGLGMVCDSWEEPKNTQLIVKANAGADHLSRLYSAPRPSQEAKVHCDFLSFALTVENEPLIIEPGCSHVLNALYEPLSNFSVHSCPHLEGEKSPFKLTFPQRESPPLQGSQQKSAKGPSQEVPQPVADSLTCSPLLIKRLGQNTMFVASRQILLKSGWRGEVERCWLFCPEKKVLYIRDALSGEFSQELIYCSEFLFAPHLSMIMRGDLGCALRGKKSAAKLIPILPRGSRSLKLHGSLRPLLGGWHYQGHMLATNQIHYFVKVKEPGNFYFVIDWSRQEHKYKAGEIDYLLNR